MRPYLQYEGTIFIIYALHAYTVESYRAFESLGVYLAQPDTYKVHYMGLCRRPRLYQVKTTYLGQDRAFYALFTQYRPYIGNSFSV